MDTCGNCMHAEVCDQASMQRWSLMAGEKECPDFKDITKFLKVKCKVGDYVYALWEAPVKLKYIIYCAEVKEIRIAVRNCRLTTTYILEPISYRGHRREYRDSDFGELVFTEESDAERKLYPCAHCISGTYRSCEGCSCAERSADNE